LAFGFDGLFELFVGEKIFFVDTQVKNDLKKSAHDADNQRKMKKFWRIKASECVVRIVRVGVFFFFAILEKQISSAIHKQVGDNCEGIADGVEGDFFVFVL
jgi:hypothetical protein